MSGLRGGPCRQSLVSIDGEIDDRQECISIYILLVADFAYRLVSEAKTNAEAAETLQQVVIILDKIDHLVFRLIHLLILHLVLLFNIVCKITKKKSMTQ